MEIQGSAGRYAESDAQALAVAVFKDEKAHEGILRELDKATGGVIKSVVEAEELKGKEGETVYVHVSSNADGIKARRLLLVGVGEKGDYGHAGIAQMAG